MLFDIIFFFKMSTAAAESRESSKGIVMNGNSGTEGVGLGEILLDGTVTV